MKQQVGWLGWKRRRNVENKFIKNYRYRQHAWTDESHMLVPFRTLSGEKLTGAERLKLTDIIYRMGHGGPIIGSSYGNTHYNIVKIRQFSKGRGVALVSQSVGIGD